MISNFLNNFEKLFKEYSKKNSGVENPFLSEEQTTTFMEKLRDLTLINLETENKDLHIHLISFIDTFIDIASKRKLKDKHLDLFLNDVKELNAYHFLSQEGEAKELFDSILDDYPFDRIQNMESEWSVSRSIDGYCNLLLSKIVDYLPEGNQTTNQWNLVLDTLNSFRTKLKRIEEIDALLVYNFTETFDYAPFSLRYLDSLNKLGEKIENWIDYAAQNRFVKMANKQGYRIFAGWGNLSSTLKLVNGQIEEEKPAGYRPDATDEEVKKIISNCLTNTGMFALNPHFRMNNPEHKTMFLKVIAMICYGDGRLSIGQIKRIVTECRAVVKKHYRNIYFRDQKLWFTDLDISNIQYLLEEYYKHSWEHIAVLVNKVCFDYATPSQTLLQPGNEDRYMQEMANYHRFLCVSYNVAYHSRNRWTSDEVKNILQHTYDYLMPRFNNMIDPDKRWIYEQGIELWLDIDRDERVNSILYRLRTWFSGRHTREENQEFFNNIQYELLLLSYSMKKRVLDSLNEEPIEFISYNGSREIYNACIAIMRKDLEDPIMSEREFKGIEVKEEGGIVFQRTNEKEVNLETNIK